MKRTWHHIIEKGKEQQNNNQMAEKQGWSVKLSAQALGHRLNTAKSNENEILNYRDSDPLKG